MDESNPEDSAVSQPAPIIDSLAPSISTDGLVKLARYGVAEHAQMNAAVLEAEGIPTQVFGVNANSLGLYYQGFNVVELYVRAEDAHRAIDVLTQKSSLNMEPDETTAGAAPAIDENGKPLVPVAAFENIKELYDARTVLASVDVDSVLPVLVPRGEKPAGHGKRFILRVAEQDLERAQSLLSAEADEDRDEPRCPHCGSWRVFPVPAFWKDMAAGIGLTPAPEKQIECLACHYKGGSQEFANANKFVPGAKPLA